MLIYASEYAFAGAAIARMSCSTKWMRPSAVRHFRSVSANRSVSTRRRCRTFCKVAGSSPSVADSKGQTPHFDGPEENSELSITEFSVVADENNMRMDKILAARFSQSRSYFHALIDASLVSVNGGTDGVSKSRKLHKGDVVHVTFAIPERERPLEPEDIPLSVLYEDEHLAVIDKPAGLVVHPAPGNWTGTLAHGLAHRYSELMVDGATAAERPGIVHRLDKGTSGALVVARTRAAHDKLQALFASRDVRKEYLAVTLGSPGGVGVAAGVIDAPLGRSPADRMRMAVVDEEHGGRDARSIFEVLTADSRGLLHVVRVRIETGRTHQIRVHMRHRRAPVLGDNLYGALDLNRRFRSAAPRPMLHAQRIAFTHPMTGEEVDVLAQLPDDFRSLITRSIDPALLQTHPEW